MTLLFVFLCCQHWVIPSGVQRSVGIPFDGAAKKGSFRGSGSDRGNPIRWCGSP